MHGLILPLLQMHGQVAAETAQEVAQTVSAGRVVRHKETRFVVQALQQRTRALAVVGVEYGVKDVRGIKDIRGANELFSPMLFSVGGFGIRVIKPSGMFQGIKGNEV